MGEWQTYQNDLSLRCPDMDIKDSWRKMLHEQNRSVKILILVMFVFFVVGIVGVFVLPIIGFIGLGLSLIIGP
jgi:hypothetical protein